MPGRLQGKRAGRDRAVLELLGRCAVEDGGWRWGGAGGWMLFDEVDAAVSERVSEVLPHLAGLGLAQRVDVRPPRCSRPRWMYRVTEAGLRLLAELQGRAPPALSPVVENPADAGRFFVPRRMWSGFSVLQARARAGGEDGWMSLRQLADARARLDSEDTAWLVRAGLVERHRDWRGAIPGAWRFRATADGLRVERTATPSCDWVPVRVPPAAVASFQHAANAKHRTIG